MCVCVCVFICICSLVKPVDLAWLHQKILNLNLNHFMLVSHCWPMLALHGCYRAAIT